MEEDVELSIPEKKKKKRKSLLPKKRRKHKRLHIGEDSSRDASTTQGVSLVQLDNMDLDNLEAIVVHSSEDSEDEFQVVSKSDHVTPFFDYLPDEILLNIFHHLTVKEVVRMSEVCWRFLHLLNEESFWDLKARRWEYLAQNEINLQQKNINSTPKEFYVQRYKENLRREAEAIRRREAEAKKLNEERRREALFYYSKFVGFSFLSMELPVILLVLLWTIFVALRADERILWDYHFVYLPVYVIFGYIAVGLILVEFFQGRIEYMETLGIHVYWPQQNIMTLILTDMKSYRVKNIIYFAWSNLLAFFVLLAEYKNQDRIIWESGWVMVPFAVLLFEYILIFLMWRGSTYAGRPYCWSDKVGLGFFLFLIVSIVVWILMFWWTKADSLANFNWYAAFSPWWIIACLATIGEIAGWIAFLVDGRFGGDSKIWLGVLGTTTFVLITVVTFMGFLSYNLENLYLDLYVWSWVVIFIPIWVLLVGCAGAFCVFYQIIQK